MNTSVLGLMPCSLGRALAKVNDREVQLSPLWTQLTMTHLSAIHLYLFLIRIPIRNPVLELVHRWTRLLWQAPLLLNPRPVLTRSEVKKMQDQALILLGMMTMEKPLEIPGKNTPHPSLPRLFFVPS
eukprot:Rmarinus@m.29439